MGEVYTGIDLGTDSIKIVVCEKLDNSFNVLASVSSKSLGIRNGQVEDIKVAVASVKRAVKKASDMLGLKITKAVVAVSPNNCRMNIFSGSWDVIDYDKITGEDVRSVLKDALVGRIDDNEEVVTVSPIEFKIDDDDGIKDPKGLPGKVLETKVVVSTLDKEPLYRILEVLKLSGIEVVDIGYTSTGDYYACRSDKKDKQVGAIINIGESSTNISIFNRGIQIRNSFIPVGSVNVDRDLSYIFKLKGEDSRNIKETFAVSLERCADSNDIMEVATVAAERVEIKQTGASKVVEARLGEILKLAKNEIKNLTKREIRYIIITGGLSEIAGFQYLVEEIFGADAKVCNISTVGIRHNKYSSVYGILKYFDDKLSLRGRTYCMISDEDRRSLIVNKQRTISNDNIVNKVFGHFFDN